MACGCGNVGCNGCNCPQVVVGQCNSGGAVEVNSTQTGCGCATAVGGYFNYAGSCQESHCTSVPTDFVYGAVKILNGWNVPACGQAAYLTAQNLQNIQIGSNLWFNQCGYFQVLAFDTQTGVITVQNNCLSGNAAVGTNVPACSLATVTPPPQTSGSGTPTLYPYVAVDFTAPPNGTCINITVTTVNGLAVGKNIQIGSGTYRLESTPNSTTIRICNDGAGITPNTPVIAKNSAGEYQYPVVLIDTNPCTNTPVTTGALLVCKDGLSQPLDAVVLGSVPVVTNVTTNEVTYQILNVPTRTCSALAACLTLVPGTLSYVITVGDSSQFEVGDILQIGTRTDRFTVTVINDATHITATVDTNPSSIQTINAGTSICIVDCCEILEAELACVVQGTRLAIPAQLNTQAITISGSGTYEVTLDSNVIQYTAPDDCPGSTYHVRAEVNLTALVDFGWTDPSLLTSELQLDWSNNVGVGGRLNWTNTYVDGLSGAYPATTLNAIWGLLQLAPNNTVSYYGGYVIADTIVASGGTVTLRLNYKAIEGEDATPDSVSAMASYLIGNLVITKII